MSSTGEAAVENANADGVPAEWITPIGADTGRVIFYLHGGGYQMGSPLTHRGLIGRLARAASARALSVDYRLAPEKLRDDRKLLIHAAAQAQKAADFFLNRSNAGD